MAQKDAADEPGLSYVNTSQVTRLFRGGLVVVVAAVEVADWSFDQLGRIYIVEASNGDDVELAAEIGVFSPCERMNTASIAKQMVIAVRSIFLQVGFP